MNKGHRTTLAAVFAKPTPSDIPWNKIESLLKALGAQVSEGSGSRVRVALNGVRAVFHRPHPNPNTNRGTVRDVARLLADAGVE